MTYCFSGLVKFLRFYTKAAEMLFLSRRVREFGICIVYCYEKTFIKCFIKQFWGGNTKMQCCIRIDWGFKLALQMYIFSQPFSIAAFLKKITIPAQPCTLALIQEQNNSWQKIFTEWWCMFIGCDEVLHKCLTFLIYACIMCMYVDTCCIARLGLNLK